MVKVQRTISQSEEDYKILEQFKDKNPGIDISNIMTASTLKFIDEYNNSIDNIFENGYLKYINIKNKEKLEVNKNE
jgi:hypothetical protein